MDDHDGTGPPPMMDLRRLQVLHLVQETGTITAAAGAAPEAS
jgi:molybdenum-dependent DNA-binding transcriptional regulator ModE